MALSQGTCSVADDGTVTKSGAAGAVYDLLLADFQAEKFTTLGPDGKPQSATCDVTLQVKRGLARQARGVAMVIPYVVANAVVNTTVSTTVTISAGESIQRQTNPLVAGADCVGPNIDLALAKHATGTGTGTIS